MRFVWISVLKDLRILRRDPFSVATWVGIPLCIGLLVRLVFGGGGGQPQGLLLIADQDQSIASRLLISAFDSEQLKKMITVEKVSTQDGRKRIDRGDGSAFLLIPKGLQSAILEDQPFRLQLFTNAGESILPKIIQETLSQMLDAVWYAQRVAAGQFRDMGNSEDPTDASVARWSVAANHLGREMRQYLNPPLIQLNTKVEEVKRRSAGTGDFFFPNLIFLSLLLMANGLTTDIWREKIAGTLRRVAVSPSPVSAFFAGRIIMVGLIYVAVAAVAVLVARYLANATVENLPAAIGWAALCGTMFYLMLLPLAMSSSEQRAANVRGNLLVFPLSMLGGCFFPFDVMPAWMARIGRLTPNGLAVTQFREILTGSADPHRLLTVAAVLLAITAVAFLLVVRQMRRGFAR